MENETKEPDVLTPDILDQKIAESNAEILKSLKEIDEKVETKINIVPSQKEEDKLLKGGFNSIGDFAKAVAGKDKEGLKKWMNIVAQSKTINEGTDSQGGFLVPPQFANTLWEQSVENDQFYNRALDMPTTSNEYHLPGLVDSSHASNLYGGVTLYYKSEESAYTASTPKFKEIVWKLNKLTGLCYISEEMLEDSGIAVAPVISRLFSNAIAWQRDKDMIIGSGAGKPLGIHYAPALVSVTKETGQTADTIVFENLTKMWARAARHSNLVWLANHDTLPQLMALTVTGGTASTPVWIPGNDASKTPNGQIFGSPVLITEHCQTLGDKGDLYLIDWSQYGVSRKVGAAGGIQIATSMHLKFNYDQMAFKIRFRWDGQPLWSTAFTPANSTNTLSPFVTLNERA